MSVKTVLGTLLMGIVSVLGSAASASAVTLVVGPESCAPGFLHFDSIQGAVNAAVPGDTTIQVCPGTYAEQVVVTQPMIILGYDDGSGQPAVITAPGTGVVPNVTMPVAGSVAAQLVLRDTWGVVVQGLTIDGDGAACAGDVGANHVVGLALLNLQSDDPSWINTYIGHNEIRNQGQNHGCDRSSGGILSENSMAEVDADYIHHVTGDAVSMNGASGLVWNNLFWKLGAGGATMTGLHDSTVANNTVTEAGYGADLNDCTNINVWNNTMGPWLGYGIYTHNGTLSWIDGNYVESTFFGIYLNGSSSDRATDNTIVTTESIGLVDIFSHGGNQIWDNVFNSAPVGIDIDEASLAIDNIGPNVFINVVTEITSAGLWY
jgi:nitrous oxidase accessory protein NosD